MAYYSPLCSIDPLLLTKTKKHEQDIVNHSDSSLPGPHRLRSGWICCDPARGRILYPACSPRPRLYLDRRGLGMDRRTIHLAQWILGTAKGRTCLGRRKMGPRRTGLSLE